MSPQLSTRTTRTRRGAFSLLELILVLAIIAIMAALAVPRYSSAQARYHTDLAARRVADDLALAQATARQQSSSCRVRFDTINHQIVLVGVAGLDRRSQQWKTDLGAAPYQARVVRADFGGDSELVYDGFGVPDTGGTIILQAGSEQREIHLDPATGRAVLP